MKKVEQLKKRTMLLKEQQENIRSGLLKELETYSILLPLVKEIYNGIETIIPTEHEELYVLSSALIAFSPIATQEELINLLIYVDKLPDEFGILILTKIIALKDVREKVISTEWIHLMRKYKNIILSSIIK
jgi:hypothetical protein